MLLLTLKFTHHWHYLYTDGVYQSFSITKTNAFVPLSNICELVGRMEDKEAERVLWNADFSVWYGCYATELPASEVTCTCLPKLGLVHTVVEGKKQSWGLTFLWGFMGITFDWWWWDSFFIVRWACFWKQPNETHWSSKLNKRKQTWKWARVGWEKEMVNGNGEGRN